MDSILNWLFVAAPFWLIAISVLVTLGIAYAIGIAVRHHRKIVDSDEQKDSLALSAVMGLLALLLGFTFSLALERFDGRRALVREEALAIRTTYLRAGTFAEPHRSHLKSLIASYADVRVLLGKATEPAVSRPLSAASDRLQRQMWQATETALVGNRDDVSSSFAESMGNVIEVDAARRAARRTHVPSRVLGTLLFYMAVSAAMIGYSLGPRRRGEVLLMLGLTTTAYLLIIDIDDATRGGVQESQAAMEDLQYFCEQTGIVESNRDSPSAFVSVLSPSDEAGQGWYYRSFRWGHSAMTAYSRKRRRRETISFIAECVGALGLVLSFSTLFFAMLGLMTLRMVVWFPIGALVAAAVAHFYKDERVAPKTRTIDSAPRARTHRPR